MRKVLIPLVVAAAGVIWAPAVSAQCTASQPFGDFGRSYIDLCRDDKPVDALVTALGSPATTGNANVICESADEIGIQGGSCQTEAGVVGDGRVTISGNYGNQGSLGCPDPNGIAGVGRNVYVIRCNDGAGVVITVGYNVNLGVFDADGAHKVDPASPTFDPLPLHAQPKGVDPSGLATGGQNLVLNNLAPGPPPMANVTLYDPTVFSDCDPDSVGTARATGSCDPAADGGGVLASSGNLYVTTGSCAGTAPARTVCNGGSSAGLPCLNNSDCGTNALCIPRWQPALTDVPQPLIAPATTNVTLPISACVGGSNPQSPCTTSANCGGLCSAGSRLGIACTTTAINGVCQGFCSGTGPKAGLQCTTTALTGVCQGTCSGGPTPGAGCTSTTTCGTGGTCVAVTCSPWPCTLGTCSALNSVAFNNQCVYLGSTFTFQSTESPSIVSTPLAFSGGGPGAPSARALDVRAAVSGGEIMIHFRTAAELQLVGFNVLTETKAKGQFKVNDSLIAPRGVGGGGATYDNVPIGRGKFQGGRTVIIESVLTDGTTLRSDAVRF